MQKSYNQKNGKIKNEKLTNWQSVNNDIHIIIVRIKYG